MTIRTSPWPAGVPCWADLTVPDVEAAKAFYGAVLGWAFRDLGPDYGGYAIAEARGADAAAIGPAQGNDAASPLWTMYFASDDADKVAAAVSDSGGTVLLGPGDVGPMGRMFVATDPTGVRFAVWQAGTHFGAGVVNEPGGLIWEDLRSPDPDTARAFYSAVFGFRMDSMEAAGPDYTTFALAGEDQPRGGIGGLGEGDGTSGPGHWLLYFGVPDTDAAVAAAEASGGSVTSPAVDTPYGRMAGLADPNGAAFWVAQTQVPQS